MAQQVLVQYLDDIDGTPAEGTTEFGLDGVIYEIDLSEDNNERLHDALDEFVNKARRTGGRKRRGPTTTATIPHSRNGNGRSAVTAQQIREWAQENDHPVADMGRIPKAIQAAFDAAHS